MAEVRRSKAEARQSKAEADTKVRESKAEADTKVRESKAEVEVEKAKAKAAAAAAKAGTAAAVSQSKAEAETRVREVKAEAAAEKKAAVDAALAEKTKADAAKASAEAKATADAKAAAALSKLCDIMISYTQKNEKAARLALNLYTDLKKHGYKVWLDLKADDKSEAAMKKAVTNSKFIIAVISDGQGEQGCAYFERPFCLKELRWAKEAGIFIQPVITNEDKNRVNAFLNGGTYEDTTRFDGAPEDLRDLGSVDFVDLNISDPEYFDVGLKKIIRNALAHGVEIDDHLGV